MSPFSWPALLRHRLSKDRLLARHGERAAGFEVARGGLQLKADLRNRPLVQPAGLERERASPQNRIWLSQ